MRAVEWLCRTAGSSAAARVPPSALLCLPDTCFRLAYSLMRAGVHVSYVDVLAAAKQGVCGAEAWVAAAHSLATEKGTDSGMPELAVAMSYMAKSRCRRTNYTVDFDCFKIKLQQQLSKPPAAASELVDALHFAATLCDRHAAAAACTAVLESDCFRTLDFQLSLEAVQQLVHTGTTRCLFEVLLCAANQPTAAQIPAAAMCSMITIILHPTAMNCYTDRAGEILPLLCRAARVTQQLDDAGAVSLFEAALKLSNRCQTRTAMLRSVISIPAVERLDVSIVEQQLLLQALHGK
ncbi:hypothetical protein COO60DRAFT_769173 [Scenedesmus sp. NREL 46B-D3]|nr:hypothetical protein COO60DRAFT_769173 [Scenedesmus sp. NREL 46B-D3]